MYNCYPHFIDKETRNREGKYLANVAQLVRLTHSLALNHCWMLPLLKLEVSLLPATHSELCLQVPALQGNLGVNFQTIPNFGGAPLGRRGWQGKKPSRLRSSWPERRTVVARRQHPSLSTPSPKCPLPSNQHSHSSSMCLFIPSLIAKII